jgi:hypothetical protein
MFDHRYAVGKVSAGRANGRAGVARRLLGVTFAVEDTAPTEAQDVLLSDSEHLTPRCQAIGRAPHDHTLRDGFAETAIRTEHAIACCLAF